MTLHRSNHFVHALCMVISILVLVNTPIPVYSADTGNALLHIPATGRRQQFENNVIIDTSNLSHGYVMCQYTGSASKFAIQVEQNNSGKVYTYCIYSDGEYIAIPLTQGNGRYTVKAWEHFTGNLYSFATSVAVNVSLENDVLPFLYTNHMVRFQEDSIAVRKGQEVTESANGNAEAIAAVYNFVVDNICYDYDKAAKISAGYISDPDSTLSSGKGICVDYSALMATMLRSQGIPVQMIYGYDPNGAYHCWVRVFSTEAGQIGNIELEAAKWTLFDPTYAANSSANTSKIINTSSYNSNFIY